jgi:hypothetical protein
MVAGLKSPAQTSVLDVSIGGNYWYNHWDPAWKDGYTRRITYNTNNGNIRFDDFIIKEFKPKHDMSLFGPALGFKFFDKIKLSAVFMYGKTFMKSEGFMRKFVYLPNLELYIMPRTFKREITKWDLDTSLGIQITSFFAIFGGFKYQGYSYKETEHTWLSGDPGKAKFAVDKRKKLNKNSGPGLGVSFNINLWESLYLQLSVSGIIMWGRDRFPHSWEVAFMENKTPIVALDFFKVIHGKYLTCGGTFSTGLAYSFSDIGVTIASGFRYQLLRYYQKVNDQSYEKIGGRFDHFYGLTVSAIYTFSFGS